jgi:hypothetical protein
MPTTCSAGKTDFLTAGLVAALAGHRGAAAAEPPGALRHLAGCFEVSYRFVEDGVHDQDIRGDLLEGPAGAFEQKPTVLT